MTVNEWIHVRTGLFIAPSVALGRAVSPWFYMFTLFVGLNLFQYGFTWFCPMALIPRKLGVPDAPRLQNQAHDELNGKASRVLHFHVRKEM